MFIRLAVKSLLDRKGSVIVSLLAMSVSIFVLLGVEHIRHQTKENFLWSRSKSFFDKDFKAEKIIVHGHTPEENIINNLHRINIDTGCYFSGKLSSVCLSDYDDSRLFINNLSK